MNKTISHRKRLETVLSGIMPDRVPVALWRHFPVDDQHPARLARATLAFQSEFDLDFVKVSPASSFCLKDWGVVSEWRGNPKGTRDYMKRVIHKPEDWLSLKELDPYNCELGAQLECLKILQKSLPSDTPFIQTIFNPLSQAKNLIHPDLLRVHIRQYPDAVLVGLNTILRSTLNFVEAVKKTGISGIFLAVQHANHHYLTESEYRQFGTALDIPILELVQDLWLNMLHIHGSHIMFEQLATYPVQIINWHDQQTEPSLATAQKIFPGVVCGGLRQIDSLVLGTPEMIRKEGLLAIEHTQGTRFILGTGCVVPIIAPYGNLKAAIESVNEV